jgi:TonB family protein
VDVLGGLAGNEIGEAYGVAGLGIVGTGSGGGGTGEETIGFGSFGTIGQGGTGYGRGVGGLGGRRARTPEIVGGQATVRGSLDREIIRRIIRRHINEVRYCYEQELVKRPGLGGRVAVQFTIAATGQVIASTLQSSTLNNARVESCIVQAVRRWEFPKPQGGGIAIVSYPFNLVPGSDWHGPAWAAPPSVAAPGPWELGLVAVRGTGDLKDRVAKVAGILVAPATDSPAVLAWWIVERHLRSGAPTPGACILAANLLREAGQPHEAGRILSEAAAVDPVGAIAEFRRWASTVDVTRLGELAARK